MVSSTRGAGKLAVITKANELATYTIHICGNESNFPKRHRWCITAKLVDAVIDINNYINLANSVYVKIHADYEIRRTYQTKGLAATYSLLSMIDIASRTFGIDSDRVKYWKEHVVEVQNLLRAWRNNDAERYKDIG